MWKSSKDGDEGVRVGWRREREREEEESEELRNEKTEDGEEK